MIGIALALACTAIASTHQWQCGATGEIARTEGGITYEAAADEASGRRGIAVRDVTSPTAAAVFARQCDIVPGGHYRIEADIKTFGLNSCQVRASATFIDANGAPVGKIVTDWAVLAFDWLTYSGEGQAPAQARKAEVRFEAALSSLMPIESGHRSGKAIVGGIRLSQTPRISVSSGRKGNVFQAGDTVALNVDAGDVPTDLPGLVLAVTVRDYRDQIAAPPFESPLTGPATHRLDLGALPQGFYACTWTVRDADRELSKGRSTCAVVPREAGRHFDQRSPLALDAGFSWSYSQSDERLAEAARVAKQAGIACLRDRLSWAGTNPARGQFDWHRYLTSAKAQEREGIAVYQIIHDCPAWASSPPEGSPTPNCAAPSDLTYVFEYFDRAVRDFGPGVTAFEIWNEPDIFFFAGRPSEYAAILKAAYLGCHRGRPEVSVLNGSLAMPAGKWYEAAFESGLAPYFDVFNMHYYGPTDESLDRLATNRAMAKRFGADMKPLWITEMGIPAGRDAAGGYVTTEKLQAAYLVRAYTQSIGEGVDRFFYFYMAEFLEWGASLWGVVHEDLTPKPAYAALASLTDVLEGCKPVGRADLGDDKSHGYLFATPKGHVLIAWNESGGTVPATIHFGAAQDIMGRPAEGKVLQAEPIVLRDVDAATVRLLAKTEAPIQPTVPSPEELERLSVVLELRPEIPGDALPGNPARKETPLIAPGAKLTLHARAHNFGKNPASVSPRIEAPEGFEAVGKLAPAELAPMGMHEWLVQVMPGGMKPGVEYAISMRADSDGHDVSPAVIRIGAKPELIQPVREFALGPTAISAEWGLIPGPGVTFTKGSAADGPDGAPSLALTMTMPDHGDRWAVAARNLGADDRLPEYSGVDLWFRADAPVSEDLVLILVENNGAQYMYTVRSAVKSAEWRPVRALFTQFELNRGVSRDDNNRLDLDKVIKFQVGVSAQGPATEIRYRFAAVRLVAF